MRKSRFQVERCEWHTPDNFDFLTAHADAQERLDKGERQRWCLVCQLWHWDHEWGNEPAGLNLPELRAEYE